MRLNFLLAAVLMISGCGTSKPLLMPQTRPLLDTELAKPCKVISKPDLADYDVWQSWALDLLEAYGQCAARHMKTVDAWPKDPERAPPSGN
jgi:hypothetical protein